MFRTDLIGNLGADPEKRYTSNGSAIINFRVAVNLRQRVGDEWKDVTEWVGVRVTGRQTEYAERMTKGTRVYVAGTLDVRRYETRDGKPGFALDVWADEIVAMSVPRSDGADIPLSEDRGARPVPADAIARSSRPDAGVAPADDSDLPF